MRRRPAWGLFAAVMLAAVVAPTPVSAHDLEQDLAGVADRIQDLAARIDDVTAARSQLAAEIRAAGGRLDRLLGNVEANRSAMAALDGQIEAQEARLDEVRARLVASYSGLYSTHTAIAGRRSAAIEWARNAYESAGMKNAALAFSAGKVTDVSIALFYLERVTEMDAEGLATLLVLEDRAVAQESTVLADEAGLADEAERMEGLQASLRHVSEDLRRDQALVEQTLAGLQELLTELDEELAEFTSELDALEQTRIKTKIAAEQARKAAPAISAAGFVRPVLGVITSSYGLRVHPVLGYTRLHTGVDMAAVHGRAIKATRDGTVILAGPWGGYGRTVVIDHGGGLSTLCAHLSSISVAEGEAVAAGNVVGKVGTSGVSTGAHLHFEVRRGGEPVDPAPFLAG